MKKIKKQIYLGFAVFLLASCSPSITGSDISSDVTSSITDTDSSSFSSDVVHDYVDLETAISNTKNYALSSSETYDNIADVISDDFVYYSTNSAAYILLEDNFYHRADIEYDDLGNDYLTVYGKYLSSSNRSDLISYYDFIKTILFIYSDDALKTDKDTYILQGQAASDLAYDVYNYFGNRNFRYATYFEIIIGENDMISKIIPYEINGTTKYEITTIYVLEFDLDIYEPYLNWVKDGSKVNVEIYDLKQGYWKNLLNYLANYQNETISIDGVIIAKDLDNENVIYIANNNANTGNVGLKVNLNSSSDIKVGSKVNVEGIIKMGDYYTPYLDKANLTYLSSEDYIPTFNEEPYLGSYGGGYWAANIFSQTPVYSDSLYTTSSYLNCDVDSIEVKENEDTLIDIIFPSQQVSVGESTSGVSFESQILLPKGMSVESRNEILTSLKGFGNYSKDKTNAVEIFLDNLLIRFNTSYTFQVQLVYNSESSIGKNLNPSEKVQKTVGLENFPYLTSTSHSDATFSYNCYTFGGSGTILEETYGISGNTTGVYYYVSGLAESDVTTYLNNIYNLGFSKTNSINDAYSQKHIILTKDNYVIDYYTVTNSFNGSVELNMWIYKGNIIHGESIEDIISSRLSFFNKDDFIKLSNIDDSSYAYYELKNYAGNIYSKENGYLPVVTIDTDSNVENTLLQQYRENKGFSTYRDENDKKISYTTRGSQHTILRKQIEGSNEYIFLDFATYSINDYQYYGADFTYRTEILIYKGEDSLKPTLDKDLSRFENVINSDYKEANIKFNFSDEVLSKISGVEIYFNEGFFQDVDNKYTSYLYYGYLTSNMAFIYTTSSYVNTLFKALKETILENDYELSYTLESGTEIYSKIVGNTTIYLSIKKGEGFVKICDSLLTT